MLIGKIYKYTNTINGKCYIGQTTNETLRIQNHKTACNGTKFHKAIKEFGYNNFDYEILESNECNDFEALKIWLNEREEFYIRQYQSYLDEFGYNVYIGLKPTISHREQSSNFFSKPFYQIEPIEGKIIHNWAKRKSLPIIYDKCNVALALANNQRYSNHYYNGFIWLYKTDYTPEYVAELCDKIENDSLTIAEYNLNGEIVKYWHSVIEAADELNVCESAIRNVMCGLSKTCKGSLWGYVGETPQTIEERVKNANESNRGKKIRQYDLNGNFIREWSSSAEATHFYGGKSLSSINNVLKGRRHTAFGYNWKYA